MICLNQCVVGMQINPAVEFFLWSAPLQVVMHLSARRGAKLPPRSRRGAGWREYQAFAVDCKSRSQPRRLQRSSPRRACSPAILLSTRRLRFEQSSLDKTPRSAWASASASGSPRSAARSDAVAVAPLEVVHQAPVEVAPHRHALGGRALQVRQAVPHEHDAVDSLDAPSAVGRRVAAQPFSVM